MIRIFINSNGRLEALAVKPDDLITYQFYASDEQLEYAKFNMEEYIWKKANSFKDRNLYRELGHLKEKQDGFTKFRFYFIVKESTALPLPLPDNLEELGLSAAY